MMVTWDPQKIERGKPSKHTMLQKQLAEESKLWAGVQNLVLNLVLGVGAGAGCGADAPV